MTAQKSTRAPIIKTPAGILVYPHLTKADPGNEKVNRDKPAYHTKIKLKLGDEGVDALLEALTRASEEALEQARKENPKLQKVLSLHVPFTNETDDTGEETGFVLLSAKMNSFYVDKKTAQVVDMRPELFDARRNKLDPNAVNIGGGTVAKLAVRADAFMMAATKLAGVSLKLVAVQILELRSWTPGGSLFDDEDGYESAEGDGGTFAEAPQAPAAPKAPPASSNDF